MSFLSFHQRGSFKNIESWLNKSRNLNSQIRRMMIPFAEQGVRALSEATPIDSHLAASSWSYTIEASRDSVTITWHNYDIENGFPVAIALQYGYGTGTGGFVQGRDYINPALRPIFDRISDGVWKVVKQA